MKIEYKEKNCEICGNLYKMIIDKKYQSIVLIVVEEFPLDKEE